MKILSSILFVLIAALTCFAQSRAFTDDLMQSTCTFQSTGRNRFFILEPGYQLVLENKQGARLTITVLNETRKVGGVETRIVEEHESENGQITEISRNFFAYCRENGGVYYFGEEVDIYRNGRVVKHEGAWLAGGPNRAGLIMPGLALLGARYYQEIAPGVAMDRAEIVAVNESVRTPAGNFANCLKTEETNELKPREREFKFYAPDVGVVQEEDLMLTKFGFVR
jgi:hypothetical protein